MRALRLLLATVAALAAGLLGLAVLYIGVAFALALVPLGGRAQQSLRAIRRPMSAPR